MLTKQGFLIFSNYNKYFKIISTVLIWNSRNEDNVNWSQCGTTLFVVQGTDYMQLINIEHLIKIYIVENIFLWKLWWKALKN